MRRVCLWALMLVGPFACGRAARTPTEQAGGTATGGKTGSLTTGGDRSRGGEGPVAGGAGVPDSGGSGGIDGSSGGPSASGGDAGAPATGGAGNGGNGNGGNGNGGNGNGGNGNGGNGNGGNSGRPSEAQRAYEAYLHARNEAITQRFRKCFGAPESAEWFDRRSELVTPPLATSLRLGLVTLDVGAETRCIEAFTTMDCVRLADVLGRGLPENSAVPECEGVLVGHVAAGDACLVNADCASAADFACVGLTGCARVCTLRPARAPNEPCSSATDRCLGGTVCRYGDDNVERCVRYAGAGSACREDGDCAPSLFCARSSATAVFDGTCRAIALGASCAGNWECPYTYVCELGANGRGTCEVGRALGELCETHLADVNGNPYSNCAPQTDCIDLDGTGRRCSRGAPLGARCGEQSDPQSPWIDCAEGYCATDPERVPAVGTCVSTNAAGSGCRGDNECSRGELCLPDGNTLRCQERAVGLPMGARCELAFGSACGPDAYCALPADWDPLAPGIPQFGTCAADRRVGETCREYVDRCEALSECIEGRCTKC